MEQTFNSTLDKYNTPKIGITLPKLYPLKHGLDEDETEMLAEETLHIFSASDLNRIIQTCLTG